MLFSLIGMKVVDVVSAFGKYVKFYETKQAAVGQATAVEQSSVLRNAFTVLMASSQARSIRPSKISPILYILCRRHGDAVVQFFEVLSTV